MKRKDKDLSILEGKKNYLMDKINAYFKEVTEYKNNPLKTKKQLVKNFDKKIEDALEIFR